jgi:hypothetical protein
MNYTLEQNQSIWLPSNIFLNGSFSNFTLQEPKSPWMHVVIGSLIGGVVGATAEVAHQCLYQQKLSITQALQPNKCKVDWLSVGLRGTEAGLATATVMTWGLASIPAKAISGAVGGATVESAFEGFDVLTGSKNEIDFGDVAIASVQGAIGSVGLYGITKLAASYKIVQSKVIYSTYKTKSLNEIAELGRSPSTVDKLKAAFKYAKFNKGTSLKYIWDASEKIIQPGIEIAERLFEPEFEDESGAYTVKIKDRSQGLDSPKVDKTYILKMPHLKIGSKGNPQAIGPSPASNMAKTASTTAGPTSLVKPLEIILVLDESGSMGCQGNLSESKIRMVKDTAKNLVDFAQIYGNIFLGVVTFASSSSVKSDLSLSSSDLKSQIEEIRETSCIDGGIGSGGTSFGYGLQEALSLFDNSRLNGDKAIIFMSDCADHRT